MKIRPITINGNLSRLEFNSCQKEEISVIEGGYIITPKGEIIVIKDNDEHRIVFSKYLNSFLELDDNKIYNTFEATKMLCELGCCVYSGIRLEYIKNKLANLDKSMASLTFPSNLNLLTETQSKICIELISKNKSLLGDNEKIHIQYGSFPDNVYTKDEIILILNNNTNKKEFLK